MKLKSISTRNLNGYINTTITWEEIGNCNIIYGDNGCGKTTILNTVYHLLSPEPGKNHRTIISNTKFSRFSIIFDNGASLEAYRENELVGPFTLSWSGLHSSDNGVIEVDVDQEDDKHFFVRKGQVAVEALYSRLAKVLPYVSFMPEDRAYIKRDDFIKASRHSKMIYTNYNSFMSLERAMTKSSDVSIRDLQDVQINAVTYLAAGVLITSIREGASQGATSTDQTYLTVVQNISRGCASEEADGRLILARLREIRNRIGSFVKLRLIEDIDVDSLEQSYEKASEAHKAAISKVLAPYVEGLIIKLDSLEKIRARIETIVHEINGYLTDKKIVFDYNDGFTVRREETDVSLTVLSSGERQLILLIMSLIALMDQKAIILIDEPEISLNVKWQRKLIQTMEKICREKEIQIVMASHSLELVSQRMNCVGKVAKH